MHIYAYTLIEVLYSNSLDKWKGTTTTLVWEDSVEVAHVSGIQGMSTVQKAESHSENIVPPAWKEC